MKITKYTIRNNKLPKGKVFALVSDLHGNDPTEVIELLKKMSPDYILAPGDIFEALDGSGNEANEAGFTLLSACSQIAPTFFAPGNHDVGATHSWSPKWLLSGYTGKEYSLEDMKRMAKTGAYFIDNSYVIYDGIAFGGLGTGLIYEGRRPNIEALSEFMSLSCPKVLLCHHPEYYEKYLKDSDIDLIVSGHAHGGQWRFFGRGVFAPGQGLFPKYTAGVHDNRLVISRGLEESRTVPRIFNPTEVVKIKIRR